MPYAFDANVDALFRSLARAAMDEIEGECGVLFVPRSGQQDYILIYSGFGNSSAVGRQGGQQELSLFNWEERYIIVHELMHALGVWHEQQRPDRDSYVIVHEDRIIFGEHNYAIQGTAFGDYNFQSIMHYDACALSVCDDCEATPGPCRVIECLPQYADQQSLMGNRTFLSDGDKDMLKFLYPLSCGLEGGLPIRVTNLPIGATLSVRTCAGDACSVLGTRPAGAVGAIQTGPTEIAGIQWWEIAWADGLIGWSAERSGNNCYLEEAPAPPDVVPPTVAIGASFENAQVSSSTLQVSGAAADPGTLEHPASGLELVEVRVNLGNWLAASGTASWSKQVNLLTGVNSIDARSRDRAGNFSPIDSAQVTFTPPDGTPPLVTILSPTSDSSYFTPVGTLSLAGTATDAVGVVQVRWANSRGGDGVAQGTANWSIPMIALQDGLNIITVTAGDAADNRADDVIRVTYRPPDLLAPTISISQPTSEPSFQTTLPAVDVRGAAADNVAVVEVSWINSAGGRGFASGRESWTAANIALHPGDNVVTVSALDAAGNRSSDAITVRYIAQDTRAPNPPTGLVAAAAGADRINLNWNATTDIGNAGVREYRIFRDGADLGGTAETNWSDAGLNAATVHCYAVAAIDQSGNVSLKSADACATTSATTLDSVDSADAVADQPGSNDSELALPGVAAAAPCGLTAFGLTALSIAGMLITSRRRR